MHAGSYYIGQVTSTFLVCNSKVLKNIVKHLGPNICVNVTHFISVYWSYPYIVLSGLPFVPERIMGTFPFC